METKIIDGKKISLEIKDEIIKALNEAKSKFVTTRKPKLIILYIGFNPASELYIKYKSKFAYECGVDVEVVKFADDIDFESVKKVIIDSNNDESIDGIMIQLPIKGNLKDDTANLLRLIEPKKDVDGLTITTLGEAWFDKNYNFASSTALAVMEVIKRNDIELDGKNVVIIGSSIVLGKPLSGMIANYHASISLLNSHTKNLSWYTKNADIIVSATGVKQLLTRDMIKENAILIDVGTNKDKNNKTHGDFDVEEMLNKASIISPSPGGVGPITVSMLIKNTVKSYIENIKE